ncbi:MAG: hypothetical protein BWY44_00147 [Candidatus Omnitrophica bacterium ADurb.Bin292]|nr:MAG: hypothetical protein BWY44_00147 [Candidatus Omnitrophica bacterium ADurb.Bin292]
MKNISLGILVGLQETFMVCHDRSVILFNPERFRIASIKPCGVFVITYDRKNFPRVAMPVREANFFACRQCDGRDGPVSIVRGQFTNLA